MPHPDFLVSSNLLVLPLAALPAATVSSVVLSTASVVMTVIMSQHQQGLAKWDTGEAVSLLLSLTRISELITFIVGCLPQRTQIIVRISADRDRLRSPEGSFYLVINRLFRPRTLHALALCRIPSHGRLFGFHRCLCACGLEYASAWILSVHFHLAFVQNSQPESFPARKQPSISRFTLSPFTLCLDSRI